MMSSKTFAVVGGNFIGYYNFGKSLYGSADITKNQKPIDTLLEQKMPAWLDGKICITNGETNNSKLNYKMSWRSERTPATKQANRKKRPN